MNETATRHFVRDLLLDEAPLGGLYAKGGLVIHNLYNPWDLLPDPTQAAGKDPHFDLTGTGTVPAPTFATRGGITVASRTTSAADNDEARLFPLAQSAWGSVVATASGDVQYIETIYRPVQITECQLYFGWKLTDTGVVATDANQALFVYDTDNTGSLTPNANWYAVTSAGGTDVGQDTGVALVAGSEYRLGILIPADQRPHFYINRKLVATATQQITTGNLLPTMGIASRAAAGAAKSFITRYIRRYVSL